MSYTVFVNHPQRGPTTVYPYLGFHADPEPPVKIWEEKVQGNCGEIRQSYDDKCTESLLLVGHNVMTTSIKAPVYPYTSLGIRLPVLILTVENIGRVYTFEVEVLDTEGSIWKFRFSNGAASFIRTHEHCCSIPAPLRDGWNELVINLKDLTKSTYGKIYKETVTLQVFSTCRLRKIQFRPDRRLPLQLQSSTSVFDVGSDNEPTDWGQGSNKSDSVIRVEDETPAEAVMSLWKIQEKEAVAVQPQSSAPQLSISESIPPPPRRLQYNRSRYSRPLTPPGQPERVLIAEEPPSSSEVEVQLEHTQSPDNSMSSSSHNSTIPEEL